MLIDLPADAADAVDSILDWAVENDATDVHFSPLASGPAVRVRIDGILQALCSLDDGFYRKVISRIKVLAEMDIAERRRPQDGRLSRVSSDRSIDFRASLVPSLHGESLVLRILDRQAGLKTINELGMTPREAGVYRSLASSPSGMVVVTGPTGAGKTTTLYAGLLAASSGDRNVITIEDPIEYEVDQALQTAVQPKIGVDFADMHRSLLRHDPDVIMIGEIRDSETAQVAVRAALTGHLVLTSLHTQRAAEAVSTLLNLGVKPYALAPALRGVIAQQLVRKVCPDCRETFDYGEQILADADMSRALEPGETASFSIGLGCDACFHRGYRGRRAIFEILEVDDRIRVSMFREQTTAAIELAAIESGMMTLRQKGFRAVIRGETTVEEIVRAVPFE